MASSEIYRSLFCFSLLPRWKNKEENLIIFWYSWLQVRPLQGDATEIPADVWAEPQCSVPQTRLQPGQQGQLDLLISCVFTAVCSIGYLDMARWKTSVLATCSLLQKRSGHKGCTDIQDSQGWQGCQGGHWYQDQRISSCNFDSEMKLRNTLQMCMN
jgi:hypothetical protein